MAGGGRRRKNKKPEDTKALFKTGDNFSDKILESLNEGNERRIDDIYKIGRLLGEGAFAKVYEAVHKESGKRVALKVNSLKIPTNVKKSKKLMSRNPADVAKIVKNYRLKKLRERILTLQNEILIMRQLSTLPVKQKIHFVDIYDVIATKKEIAMSLDLLSGGELFDRVQEKGEYSEHDAAVIMSHVVTGIRDLHNGGVIHRDLKPENLVFGEDTDESIKIADFGLAYYKETKDIFAGKTIGSPGYMSPEILTRKMYSPACDIWALGCIMFILLIGGPPFGGDDDEMIEDIKRGEYYYPDSPDVPRISASAKDLIGKMLCVDPHERIRATDILKHQWFKENMERKNAVSLLKSAVNIRLFNARKRVKKLAVRMVWGSQNKRAQMLRDLLKGNGKPEGFSKQEIIDLREFLFVQANDKNLISLDDFAGVIYEDMKFYSLPPESLFALFPHVKGAEARAIEGNDARGWSASSPGSGGGSSYLDQDSDPLPLERFESVVQMSDRDAAKSAVKIDLSDRMVDVTQICVLCSTAVKGWTTSEAMKYCFETYEKAGQGDLSRKDVQNILLIVMGEQRIKGISKGMKALMDKMFQNQGRVNFGQFRNKMYRYGGGFKRGFDKVAQPLARNATRLMRNLTQAGITQANRFKSVLTLSSLASTDGGSRRGSTFSRIGTLFGGKGRRRDVPAVDREEKERMELEYKNEQDRLFAAAKTLSKPRQERSKTADEEATRAPEYEVRNMRSPKRMAGSKLANESLSDLPGQKRQVSSATSRGIHKQTSSESSSRESKQ